MPLPFIEGSHFAGSLVGTALLLVAPALKARLRSGFQAARVLLDGGIAFSLLKGFDYEEALLQLVILGVLQYAQGSFLSARRTRGRAVRQSLVGGCDSGGRA